MCGRRKNNVFSVKNFMFAIVCEKRPISRSRYTNNYWNAVDLLNYNISIRIIWYFTKQYNIRNNVMIQFEPRL